MVAPIVLADWAVQRAEADSSSIPGGVAPSKAAVARQRGALSLIKCAQTVEEFFQQLKKQRIKSALANLA